MNGSQCVIDSSSNVVVYSGSIVNATGGMYPVPWLSYVVGFGEVVALSSSRPKRVSCLFPWIIAAFFIFMMMVMCCVNHFHRTESHGNPATHARNITAKLVKLD